LKNGLVFLVDPDEGLNLHQSRLTGSCLGGRFSDDDAPFDQVRKLGLGHAEQLQIDITMVLGGKGGGLLWRRRFIVEADGLAFGDRPAEAGVLQGNKKGSSGYCVLYSDNIQPNLLPNVKG
jgi:hypothetical protein